MWCDIWKGDQKTKMTLVEVNDNRNATFYKKIREKLHLHMQKWKSKKQMWKKAIVGKLTRKWNTNGILILLCSQEWLYLQGQVWECTLWFLSYIYINSWDYGFECACLK